MAEARLHPADFVMRDARQLLEATFAKATGGRTPYGYQRRLALGPRLPALMHVPTGSGKTLAVLVAWLFRRRFHPETEVRDGTPRRLFYCLPMRVLVEQTVGVARQALDGLASDLGPDAPVVRTLMGGDSDDEWVRYPGADAILVGTQDMLLSRALNRGYGIGRFRWPQAFP